MLLTDHLITSIRHCRDDDQQVHIAVPSVFVPGVRSKEDNPAGTRFGNNLANSFIDGFRGGHDEVYMLRLTWLVDRRPKR